MRNKDKNSRNANKKGETKKSALNLTLVPVSSFKSETGFSLNLHTKTGLYLYLDQG